MQGLFNVLETELQSYIHFADRLDNLYVLCMTFFLYNVVEEET